MQHEGWKSFSDGESQDARAIFTIKGYRQVKKETNPITVKKSYSKGCVAIGIDINCRGWQGPSAKITSRMDITAAQARELGLLLLLHADKVDAKTDAQALSEARRQKYREREIAAGRLIVMKGSPF